MTSLFVTIRAIRGYLAKAREAQQQFDEAAADMKRAAEELCSRWQGDAAVAFAKEQGVFDGWCKGMSGLGQEYMVMLDKAISTYESTEAQVKNLITKR